LHLAELGPLRHQHESSGLRPRMRGRFAGEGLAAATAGAAAATARAATTAAAGSPAAVAATTVAATAAALAALAAGRPVAVTTATLGHGGRRVLLALRGGVRAEVGLADDLAVEDPDLHAGRAVDREGGRLGVVDVGSERVERHAPFEVALGPPHLGAAEAAGELDADALRAHAHRGAERLLHRAAVGHAALQLLRDVLRDEGGVQLRPLDLVDVD